MDINTIFEAGVKKLQEDHAAHEVEKVGILRAGNTGVYEDGEVSGKCARLTYLRFKGIEVGDDDNSKELMFDSGRGNEDLWLAVLKASGQVPVIRCEEEVPISWKTDKGILVTGRPDVVLCDSQAVPVHGIELKLLCSMWTALDALSCKPKAMHIMQASHYAWQLGVPFDLWYTSRVNWYIPDQGWIQNKLPKQGEPGSELIEYTVKLNKKTNKEETYVKTLKPFRRGFNLKFNEEGAVLFKEVSSSEWQESLVSIKRIKAYFELVASMDDTKELPPKPINLDALGNEGGYDICNYCELQEVCKKADKNLKKKGNEQTKVLDSWLKEVVEFVTQK